MRLIIGLFIFALVGIAVYEIAWFSSGEEITIEVTDKERIVESDGEGKTSSKYLVFTESETFENTDVLMLGKFNSSDLQGHLKPGRKYKVKVYGWRVPFFSSYRNIVSITGEITEEPNVAQRE